MNSNWDEHWIRILICLWFQGFVWYFKVCGNQCRTRTSKTFEGAPGFFFGPPPRTGMVVLSEQWVCGEKSRDFMTQTHCSLKTTIPVLGGGPKKNPGAPSNVLDVRVLHWLPHTLKYQTKPWRSYPMLISFSFCFVISIRTYTLLVYWGTRGEDSWRRGRWGDSCWWRQPCLLGFLLKRR